jgi:endonuclease/exonuclease/phosphatase family metal-dependent hydrolase
VDLTRLRDAVAGLRADIVAVQEVDRGQERSHGADLTAELGLAHHRFVPAVIGTPGAAWRAAEATDGDGGPFPAYGIGLASRWPVRCWYVVRLPASPLRAPVLVPGPSRRAVLLLRDEPRVLLSAVVETPYGPLTVATTHLSFVPGWNVRQLRTALAAVARLPGPRLLAGDLNLPGAVVRAVAAGTGWRSLARVATYPVERPRIQFDHVLAHRWPARTAAAQTHPLPVSDHRALVVELDRDGVRR